jgi:SNF2 family DNA or RNA helicase
VPVCPVCGNVSTHWRRRDQGFSWTCRHPAHNRRLIAAGQPPVAPTTLSESVCPVCGQSRPDFGHWAQTVESAALAGYAPKSANPKAQYPLYKRVKDAFECVILDEAQTAKSKSSLAGQAARSLRAPLRMLVTGTLIKGYLPDIYYSLGWLLGWDTPQWPFRYGDIRRFLETFGAYERLEGEDGEFGDWKLLPEASNLCALWNLLAPWVSRFKKADVLDLPVKEQHLLYLEMPQEQRELYDQLHAHAYSHLRNALFSEGLDNQARARAVMAALWPLRYAASCPTSAKATWDGIEPLPGGYQSAKVREAMRLVEEIRSKGERVVIFTSLADLLADMGRALGLAGINYCQITARENARERLYLVDKFNHGREPVLLASMGALGHGVTITGANHVVLMNEEWSPELTAQAQDRVHRIGQDKPVHVYQLLCKGTIDEDMHSLNVQKLAAQAAVLDRTPASEQAEQSLRGHEDVRLLLARRIIARLPVSRPKGNRKRVVTVVPSGPVSGVQLRLF